MTREETHDRVGLVIVSHSAELASGVVDLARQMAPDVQIVPAGGNEEGGIGTSFDLIEQAVTRLLDEDAAGAVVLYDLGSAQLTAEMVLEMLDPDQRARCDLVDAPLVEGAIAAAVTAQGGSDLQAVAQAARAAGSSDVDRGAESATSARSPGDEPRPHAGTGGDWVCSEVTLTNPLGLHARPAARLARELGDVEATVALGDGRPVDLRSVMTVVGLGARGGDRVRLCTRGEGAGDALARLTALAEDGFGERIDAGAPTDSGAEPTPVPVGQESTGTAHGPVPGSGGLAIGELVHIDTVPRELPTDLPAAATSSAPEQLRAAVTAAAGRLDHGDEFARTHATLLRDPALVQDVLDRLQRDAAVGVARAWWSAVTSVADEAAAAADPVLASRAVDVLEAGAAVLHELGVEARPHPDDIAGRIVLADDLGPAAVTALAENGAAGAVLRRGQATAHAVVVASGFGLPMVIRVGTSLDDALGSTVIIDGGTGSVEIDPGEQRVAAARTQIEASDRARELARRQAQEPVAWRGRPVVVAANIGSISGAEAAVLNGADAVGLLRTELLVLEESRIPSEDDQVESLRAVLQPLGTRPVVVRVLDPGGDKPVRALDLTERDNGFLGVRGLRYLLNHPELLRTQLRAVLRASVGHRVSVMAPMVTTAAEAQAFRAAVGAAGASLVDEGVDHQEPRGVGVMVEVPAAALSVAQLAPYVDFLSVGTNDLMSYLSAADRTSAQVADLLDMGSVALWRLLGILCTDAREHGLPVAVCGELAGRPEHTRALLDLGVHELSMAPARIPAIKGAIRDLSTGLGSS